MESCAAAAAVGVEKPALMAATLDGAQLTNVLGHVTAGVKVIDPRATDPVTGTPLCVNGKFQTRDLCFPCQMTWGQDCKALHNDCFGVFFECFHGRVAVPGINGLPELSNFEMLSTQDMSSIWKTAGLGGGSSSKEQFCHCCVCSKHDKATHKNGDSRCPQCTRLSINKCFCCEAQDLEKLEETRQMLEECVPIAVDEGHLKLDTIAKNSVTRFDPLQADRIDDPSHIDFEPNMGHELDQVKALLSKELRLRLTGCARRTTLGKGLEDRRERLRQLLSDEQVIQLARKALNKQDAVNMVSTRLLCEQALPCVMHAEMRMNEKLFHCLLSMAMDRHQDVDSKLRKELICTVTECMCSVALGDEGTGWVGQWTFPLAKGGKTVGERSTTAIESRKCVAGMKTLASLLFAEEPDQTENDRAVSRAGNVKMLELWHGILETCNALMPQARQHDDFTGQEMDVFHVKCQDFMFKCLQLMKTNDVTNCIHMIGAGHFTCCLRRCRNLCKCSQQGWEAMNQKLKHFHFSDTNHGGCGRNAGEMLAGDHVCPLMRMCQRFIVWKLGLGDAFFINCGKEKSEQEEQETLTHIVNLGLGGEVMETGEL